MTSTWAFRKAISNLHFDLVVSKLLKITAALSWNQNMLAAPQDCELKPQIYPRRKLEKGIKPQGGKSPFFLIPLFPLLTHPQTHPNHKGRPPPTPRTTWGKVPPATTHPELSGRWIGPTCPVGGGGEAGRKPLARRRKRRAVWLGFVLGQLDKAGGNDVCPGQRVLIS